MSNFIYNNPLSEAATMGGQLGQTLGQISYGVPMQRAQMNMQLAEMVQRAQQMQQMGQYRQGMLGVQQQRADDLNKYHQDQLQNQSNFNGIRGQNEQLGNQIRAGLLQLAQQRAQQPRVEGGYLIPGIGGQQQQMGGMPQEQEPSMLSRLMQQQGGQGLPQTNTPMQQTMQQGQMPMQQGLPNGIMQLPRPELQQRPATQGQVAEDKLKTLGYYLSVINSTNTMRQDPKLAPMLSNQVYNASSPYQQSIQTNGLPQSSQNSNDPLGLF